MNYRHFSSTIDLVQCKKILDCSGLYSGLYSEDGTKTHAVVGKTSKMTKERESSTQSVSNQVGEYFTETLELFLEVDKACF